MLPMTLDLSGQSVNFSLKRMVSMLELIRPNTVQSGLKERWFKSCDAF